MSGARKSEKGWIPAVGELVDDRYRIEEHLDRGGMGVVLRATDVQTHTEVAIKLLSPSVASQETYRKRFKREVEVIAKIDHPNVLRAFAFGESHGRLYIVTELLQGDSLKALVRREGRLGTRRTVAIGREILRGLRAAHDADVVHRDIKPENVFVETREGGADRVKVLDFGLAKSITSDENKLTATGMVCGTASYVAPETLVTDQPDKAADVYATALVLLEMLFGRPVYSGGSTTQTFMQQLVIPARIPRRLWDEPLGGVLARALNKHPDERYRDAGQMLEALDEIAAATSDFVLEKQEIPPRPPEDLSGFLLDHLADGQNRTKATLRRLPRPEPYDPSSEAPDDRETLQMMIEDIVSGEQLDAFINALEDSRTRQVQLTESAEVSAVFPAAADRGSRWKVGVGLLLLTAALLAAWVVTREPLDKQATAESGPNSAATPSQAAAPTPSPSPSDGIVVEPIPDEAARLERPSAVQAAQPEAAKAVEEPVPEVREEPQAAAPRARKTKAATGKKSDAEGSGGVEEAADKLVEQYVPMP